MKFSLVSLWCATYCPLFCNAKTHVVFPSASIQDALDVAADGDKILIQPGTYHEGSSGRYGLRVSKHGITLKGTGKPGSVRLLASASKSEETGIYAAPPGCEYDDSECQDILNGFKVIGISVEGFPANGIQVRWVEDFAFQDCQSVNNLNNGLYVTLSKVGLIDGCESSGSLDSGLWIAGSKDTNVTDTEIHDCVTGFEVTVSDNMYATRNNIHDNVVGIGLYHPNMAGTNPDYDSFADWVFEKNEVYSNNLYPNPAVPGSFQSNLPSGIGILMVGVSGHNIEDNDVRDNDSVGLLVAGYCTVTVVAFGSSCDADPPKNGDPSINRNLFEANRFADNGGNLDDLLSGAGFPPSHDIFYVQSPSEIIDPEGDMNCFRDNVRMDGASDPISLALSLDPLEVYPSLPTIGCNAFEPI